MDILARRLTTRLDHLRLSMAELERRAGLHRQTLKKLATGTATTLPPAASFLRLCEVVGLRPLELLGLAPAPGDGATLPLPAHEAEVRGLLAQMDRFDEAHLALAVDLVDTLHRHAAALDGVPKQSATREKEKGGVGARGARRAQPIRRSSA